MLKYIITTKCKKQCPYCITKNIQVDEYPDLQAIPYLLRNASVTTNSKEIMLTGGEPTNNWYRFFMITGFCNMIFDKVFLTTQNVDMLSINLCQRIDAITFSLHERVTDPPKVEVSTPIYASILAVQFYQDLPERLKKLGYAGLTINEEQREGFYFNESIVQEFPNFSLKINKRGHCMKDPILLPDLTLINDFTPYL